MDIEKIVAKIEEMRDIAASNEAKANTADLLATTDEEHERHRTVAQISTAQRLVLQQVIDETFPEWTVHWFHTGKYEATYKVHASSQEAASEYVAEHRMELDPEKVFPLSYDYQQYL